MADHLPKFLPGASVTFTADGDVVSGQVAAVSGDRTVSTAGASDIGIGTFAFSAADGNAVTVHVGALVDTAVAASTIAAGDEVGAAADGKVQTLAEGGARFGIALTSADADGTVELARI